MSIYLPQPPASLPSDAFITVKLSYQSNQLSQIIIPPHHITGSGPSVRPIANNLLDSKWSDVCWTGGWWAGIGVLISAVLVHVNTWRWSLSKYY